MKNTFVLVLAPKYLANPDTDLCVQLPQWIENQSQGEITALGWGYSIEDDMHFFFAAKNKEHGLQKICQVLASELILGNDFSSAIVAWRATDTGAFIALYPSDIVGRVIEDIDA